MVRQVLSNPDLEEGTQLQRLVVAQRDTRGGSGRAGQVLIPFFLSVALVTPYAIACTLAALLFVLIEPLTDVVFPMASEHEARRDRQGLQKTVLLTTKVALAVILPAAIVLATMGDSLLDLWIGSEYVQAPPALLPIVLSSFMVTVFFMPANGGCPRKIPRAALRDRGVPLHGGAASRCGGVETTRARVG